MWGVVRKEKRLQRAGQDVISSTEGAQPPFIKVGQNVGVLSDSTLSVDGQVASVSKNASFHHHLARTLHAFLTGRGPGHSNPGTCHLQAGLLGLEAEAERKDDAQVPDWHRMQLHFCQGLRPQSAHQVCAQVLPLASF